MEPAQTVSETARALEEAEIVSLVRLAGQGSYQPGASIPGRKPSAFRSRSLLDIARDARPEPPPRRAPDPAPAPAAPETRSELVEDAELVLPPAPEAVPVPSHPEPHAAPLSPAPAPVPEPPRGIDPEIVAREKEEAYISGFRAGEAQARREIDAETVAALDALDRATRALTEPGSAVLDHLGAVLRDAVLGLASARAGARIDEMPLPFLRRIEAMVEQVQADLRGIVLRLHPADAAALRSIIGRSETLGEARIIPSEALNRGDVDIAIGGVRLLDALPVVTPPPVVAEGDRA